jgi:hypothetical protein
MNLPIFGSRIWKLDKKVATPDNKHYMRFIEDRPDLLENLREILGWYENSGRFFSDEFDIINHAIKNLVSGLVVEDFHIEKIEEIANHGCPPSLDHEIISLIKEMSDLSDHPEVDLRLSFDLKSYIKQFSSRDLIFSRRKMDDNLESLANDALVKARNLSSKDQWAPSESEIKNLKLIMKLISSRGSFFQTQEYEFSRAKQYLINWLKINKGQKSNFPRRYYDILKSFVSKELKELSNPTFKPSELALRKKRPRWSSKKETKESILVILSGPDFSEFPIGLGVHYSCFDSENGETKVKFTDLKKIKIKKNQF